MFVGSAGRPFQVKFLCAFGWFDVRGVCLRLINVNVIVESAVVDGRRQEFSTEEAMFVTGSPTGARRREVS